MTLFWCEFCHENHAKADECGLYTGEMRLTNKQARSYERRRNMHQSRPSKGGCVVWLAAGGAVILAAAEVIGRVL